MVLGEAPYQQLYDAAQTRFGGGGRQRVEQWVAMLETAKDKPSAAKLMVVNDYFNRTIGFSDDEIVWGESDYWATPLETIGRQAGDCEDFSIAKYMSLLALGVPVDQLRLVYVKATILGRRQAHMVVAYYPTPVSDPLILDNISAEILPASRRKDLTPVFSFNSAGLWLGGEREPKVRNPETRISRWRDVIDRMQAEGLWHEP